MALNFQTSTLSLTLPISCQICLGKVRQPVVCANHHVFCSPCMEMWLKKTSQCPTCRVPITAENPCREIIGGTNESDQQDSLTMRKCLRKTRGELLLREYEEEIEGFIRENDDLKIKNQRLESQLKTALDPCSINRLHTEDKQEGTYVLEEWTNKLRAATDVCEKVKQDMDKLKEANKALRSQNVDLVQENMRLKGEVASRSPQKFGRCTVAALEAKIQQHERDVDHLKRALERSDQYIEDLESRVRQSEKRGLEGQEACKNGHAEPETLSQQHKINMMMRSLSDNERESICSNPVVEGKTFSRNPSLVFMSSAEHKETTKNPTGNQKNKDLESTLADILPTTPSSAFRSLTLRSPGVREKKVAFKPASYLRKLDFEEFPSPDKSSSTTENQFGRLNKFTNGLSVDPDVEPSKSVFWVDWQSSQSNGESCPGPTEDCSIEEAASGTLEGDESGGFDISSEASMDAAYLDKISELDSMMLDGESCSSRGSQLSLASSPHVNLENTLVSEAKTLLCVLSTGGDENAAPCDQKNSPLNDAGVSSRDQEAPKGSAEESALVPDGKRGGQVPYCGPPHADELSFDLLFDSLDEDQAGPSGSLSPASQDRDHVNSSPGRTSKPANATRERPALNTSQPTKRKSHSPFNTSSPTKLSKLM
ncbi:ORC ubiquitin ligase 1 [Spinachia spinachia]